MTKKNKSFSPQGNADVRRVKERNLTPINADKNKKNLGVDTIKSFTFPKRYPAYPAVNVF